MKIRTVRDVILLVSSIAVVISLSVAVILAAPWWVCIITGVVVFAVMYLMCGIIFRQYILFQIKPLWQILLHKDLDLTSLSEHYRKRVDDDMVNDIREALDNLVDLGDNEFERLKRREAERSEFLTSIFHEIHTPIFNIEGYTQTLLDGGLEDPEVNRQYLERTIRSVERLATLVKDIDLVARYESGGMVMHKAEFCIVELVHEVADTHILALQEKNLRVDIVTKGFREPYMVYADRLRISQVLEQLLSNAIRYSHPNGVIRVSFVDVFEKILVEVSDQGVGIPPSDILRVFEPFYRVDKSRSRQGGGPGIGLYSVKQVIEAHQEHITVRSDLHMGTTFSFSLSKTA